jgi:hypothetical protein
MVDISWYIQHYPAIVHVLWGLYCRPDLYNSGGTTLILAFSTMFVTLGYPKHKNFCHFIFFRRPHCVGAPTLPHNLYGSQEFFRLSKMSYISHSWMACWGHLSQVFWGMRGHLLVLLSVVSPLNQPREFGTSTVEYLSSNIIILSYVVIYYHILSYIIIYYHILSYIII